MLGKPHFKSNPCSIDGCYPLDGAIDRIDQDESIKEPNQESTKQPDEEPTEEPRAIY